MPKCAAARVAPCPFGQPQGLPLPIWAAARVAPCPNVQLQGLPLPKCATARVALAQMGNRKVCPYELM
ncbi:MAG: hypothetical protein HZC38_13630 [Chloroflexi bacterium]|nr:hypothetical protein [Chloroflexota bacterium]